MDTGQALTRFFKRDSSHAGNLTIHPHKEREFWLWVSTWAVFIQKPSDLVGVKAANLVEISNYILRVFNSLAFVKILRIQRDDFILS